MKRVHGGLSESVKHEDDLPFYKIMSHHEKESHREIASLYVTLMKVRAMNAARRKIEPKHS